MQISQCVPIRVSSALLFTRRYLTLYQFCSKCIHPSTNYATQRVFTKIFFKLSYFESVSLAIFLTIANRQRVPPTSAARRSPTNTRRWVLLTSATWCWLSLTTGGDSVSSAISGGHWYSASGMLQRLAGLITGWSAGYWGRRFSAVGLSGRSDIQII